MKTRNEALKASRDAKRAKATKEYQAQQAKAERLLAEIAQGLAKHNDAAKAGGLNWGHVGDLQELTYRLGQMSDLINNTENYGY